MQVEHRTFGQNPNAGKIELIIVPYLVGQMDNYGYLLRDEQGVCLAIDPGEAAPFQKVLEQQNWSLSAILITHSDWDHTDGVEKLQKAQLSQGTSVQVYGDLEDEENLPPLTQGWRAGNSYRLGSFEIEVLKTSGHRKHHLSFYFPQQNALFVGDTLFRLGCGRMFSGPAPIFWDSLRRLRELPDETELFFGHEYSQTNAAYACSLEPDNTLLKKEAQKIAALRQLGKNTTPTLLGTEKKLNPYLRVDESSFCKKFGFEALEAAAFFAFLRAGKDQFKG